MSKKDQNGIYLKENVKSGDSFKTLLVLMRKLIEF